MGSRSGSHPKGVVRRAELLRTTFAVVEKLGANEASMRTIAREAGISLAGLLHYFPTRDALMLAVLEMVAEEGVRSHEEANSTGEPLDPADLLVAAMERHMATPVSGLLYFSIVAASTNHGHPAAAHFAQRYETFRAAIVDYVRAEQASGGVDLAVDADFAASSLLASADGIEVQWLHDRSINTSRHVRRTWQMLLRRPAVVGAAAPS